MVAAPAKALILDFGGAISKTLFETHGQTEAALGLTPGTLTWRGPFAPASDPLWRAMQAGRLSERDYWMTRAREVGGLVGEAWDATEILVKRARAAEPEAVVRPEADRAIRRAHAAGVRLAILSNEFDLFYGADFQTCLPLLGLFEAIVDATYTGTLKPDPRAYDTVLQTLDLPPDACVFVDDQERNIEGARAKGLKTVHFDVRHPARSYAEALEHFDLSFM